MGASNAYVIALSNNFHLDASANYKFTHSMFENVVNYLSSLFSLSAPILFPKAKREKENTNPQTNKTKQQQNPNWTELPNLCQGWENS